MERMLLAVRHGQSEWNLQNRFRGWKDPDLARISHGIEAHRGL
jgi:2,3-bisphosphoglycerate-dependent phosphoglycerate mutase